MSRFLVSMFNLEPKPVYACRGTEFGFAGKDMVEDSAFNKHMILKACMVLLATDAEHLAAFVADQDRASEKAGCL